MGNVSDLREPQLVAAVRAIVADAERQVAREIVVARGVERLLAIAESERPAERVRRENEWALREMKARGNTPGAAWIVAGRLSTDPHTRKILAQRFRRVRRRHVKIKKSSARLRVNKGRRFAS